MRQWCALLCVFLSSFLFGQPGTCNLPPIQVEVARDNLFSEEQEQQLGDIVAEQAQQSYKTIRDEALVAHLREIGEKLLQQLPTKLRYRFELIELDHANAFSFPGGRIVVSRKAIALAQSDDEIAGILAHELGHSVTHQSAVDLSRAMKRVLGIQSVTTKEDIRTRYNQFLDNWARKPSRDDTEDEQREADAVGIQAMVRAGYDPNAWVSYFGRLSGIKDARRGFWADFFGFAASDLPRLKAAQRLVASLPQECANRRATGSGAFLAWRDQVIAYTGGDGGVEEVPGLLFKRKLSPALRPDTEHIRYSADGKYLLVQDPGTIHVLSRDPMVPLFQIPAFESGTAEFTSDGQLITFHSDLTSSPRIEQWSVQERKRVAVHELHTPQTCLQAALANNGKTFACLARKIGAYNFGLDLLVYDVVSGKEVFRKEGFWAASGLQYSFFYEILSALTGSAGRMAFTPDGRYLLASSEWNTVGFDTENRIVVAVPDSIKGSLGNGFVFLSSDRILVRRNDTGKNSQILRFPTGEVIKSGLNVGNGSMSRAGSPDYVLLRPIPEYKVGVFDLVQNKLMVGGKHPAIDAWSGEFAGELRDGMFQRMNGVDFSALSAIKLPDGHLGRVQAAWLSPDMKWVAMSAGPRGGIWHVESGRRRYAIRGFTSAFLSNTTAILDVPPLGDARRSVGLLSLNSEDIQQVELAADIHVSQYGPVMVLTRDREKRGGKHPKGEKLPSAEPALPATREFEFQDSATLKPLWTRTFPKDVDNWFANPEEDSIAFFTQARDKYLLEFHQLTNGKEAGSLKIDSGKGSFEIENAISAGGYFVVSDSENRVSVYDKDGAQVARLFTTRPVISPATGVMIGSDAEDRVGIYDLSTGERRGTLQLSFPVVFYQFDGSGHKLVVLTSDQTVYGIDIDAIHP